MSTVRQAHVAGQFYPGDKSTLLKFMQKNVPDTTAKEKVLGVIMPHAGYIYSGKTAALTIARVEVPSTVLLIGPNHTGYGTEFSLMAEGQWNTPVGTIPIDEKLGRELVDASTLIQDDASAHMTEHSLEVELPFLHYLNNKVKIVPLTVSPFEIKHCRLVGEAIARCLSGKNVLMVASSDMTHYESQHMAEKKDNEAINAVLALDEDRLAKVVSQLRISMCGFLPVYIMLVAAKKLGAKMAELVDYRTSGEASGDYNHVVGYAGVIIK